MERHAVLVVDCPRSLSPRGVCARRNPAVSKNSFGFWPLNGDFTSSTCSSGTLMIPGRRVIMKMLVMENEVQIEYR